MTRIQLSSYIVPTLECEPFPKAMAVGTNGVLNGHGTPTSLKEQVHVLDVRNSHREVQRLAELDVSRYIFNIFFG
jgi:hypothetical protein